MILANYHALTYVDDYNISDFLDPYLKYNITYTKEMLYEKIKSKSMFYKKPTDEEIRDLVKNPKPYEWYRSQIEEKIYGAYLEELYSK